MPKLWSNFHVITRGLGLSGYPVDGALKIIYDFSNFAKLFGVWYYSDYQKIEAFFNNADLKSSENIKIILCGFGLEDEFSAAAKSPETKLNEEAKLQNLYMQAAKVLEGSLEKEREINKDLETQLYTVEEKVKTIEAEKNEVEIKNKNLEIKNEKAEAQLNTAIEQANQLQKLTAQNVQITKKIEELKIQHEKQAQELTAQNTKTRAEESEQNAKMLAKILGEKMMELKHQYESKIVKEIEELAAQNTKMPAKAMEEEKVKHSSEIEKLKVEAGTELNELENKIKHDKEANKILKDEIEELKAKIKEEAQAKVETEIQLKKQIEELKTQYVKEIEELKVQTGSRINELEGTIIEAGVKINELEKHNRSSKHADKKDNSMTQKDETLNNSQEIEIINQYRNYINPELEDIVPASIDISEIYATNNHNVQTPIRCTSQYTSSYLGSKNLGEKMERDDKYMQNKKNDDNADMPLSFEDSFEFVKISDINTIGESNT